MRAKPCKMCGGTNITYIDSPEGLTAVCGDCLVGEELETKRGAKEEQPSEVGAAANDDPIAAYKVATAHRVPPQKNNVVPPRASPVCADQSEEMDQVVLKSDYEQFGALSSWCLANLIGTALFWCLFLGMAFSSASKTDDRLVLLLLLVCTVASALIARLLYGWSKDRMVEVREHEHRR